MLNIKQIPVLIVIISLGIILWNIFTNHLFQRNTEKTNTSVDTIIIYDTIIDTFIVENYIPEIIYRDTSYLTYLTDTVIDTITIIRNHFTKNYITDTLLINDRATIIIRDTIWQNTITSRTPEIRTMTPRSTLIRRPQSYYTAYVGMMAAGSRRSFGIGPAISVNYKKNNVALGYNLMSKEVLFSWKWALF